MNAGNVEQFGQPFEIYNSPATRFVATFVGTLNTLAATVDDVTASTVRLGSQAFAVPALPTGRQRGDAVTLTLRPEAITLGTVQAGDIAVEGTVSAVSFLGSVIRVQVDIGGNRVSLDTFNDKRTPPPAVGDTVRLGIAPGDILALAD